MSGTTKTPRSCRILRFRRRWAVRAFDDELRLNVGGVVFGDLVLEGGGDPGFDVQPEDVVLAERLPFGEAGHRLVLRDPFGQLRNVEALPFWTPPFQSVTPMILAAQRARSQRRSTRRFRTLGWRRGRP